MTVNPDRLLSAARAEHIPVGWSGLWFIRKFNARTPMYAGGDRVLPAGTYTHLFRMTDATIHLEPPGVVVMEDTPFELKKHLEFMMRASGDVLVTGLGLGCVVRGLLANPAVKYVTCIEKSEDVLKLVLPYMPEDRLTVVQADALEWAKSNTARFDYAWHDLWSDRDSGDPHLDLWHTMLMFDLKKKVGCQGAWGYSRVGKRLLQKININLIG